MSVANSVGQSGTAALFKLADARLQIVDVLLQQVDVLVVKAFVARLIASDLPHELAQIQHALLDAIEPLVGASIRSESEVCR